VPGTVQGNPTMTDDEPLPQAGADVDTQGSGFGNGGAAS